MTDDSQDTEFPKYETLRDAGTSAKETYLQPRADDLTTTECIRMLRVVFGHSLEEAKAIIVVGDGLADSLDEYQEKFVPGLKKFLESDKDDD